MITLALDTSGPWCTVAIVSPDRVLANPSENIGKGHAERLAPMVAKALDQSGLLASQIGRVAVCTGPGSFTGLRVALAFGRSFALPGKLPVIGVSALQAMAVAADPEARKTVMAAVNAKRGDICWAIYENGVEMLAPQTQKAEVVKDRIRTMTFDQIVGDANEILGLGRDRLEYVNGPILGWMAADLDPLFFAPDPLYARGPDAKLPGGITP